MASSSSAAAAAEATSAGPNPKRGRRGAAEKLWTEAEEMAILEGFLEFVTERGTPTRAPDHHHHHHDTAPFFERIRPRLRRADLNRAQLADKLRRLKRKYRAAASRLAAAPSAAAAAAFRTPHDRATFELARKIWSPATPAPEPEEGRKGMEEKWREQQILELEVLLKRAELLHEHFSAKLEEMRSTTTTTSSN
ncbi:probable transcription factor At4g00390 [Ananas comosus]|uniref:Probable transcription factor At4g00390 n=1 Tax=Ananas comosus TaxID=4615 RepID=A0A6P5FYX0_ANACO|nr:probable transcription factor At4g00390 [Ananas comosus]